MFTVAPRPALTRTAKLAALLAPLAVLSAVAACNESASATPTAPTVASAGVQTNALAGGKGLGGVRAYAFVHTVSVTLDQARTRGFTAVSSPGQGIFCLTPADGISPETAPAIVGAATNFYNLPVWDQDSSIPACSAGQYRVALWDMQASHLTSLYGFTILIP